MGKKKGKGNKLPKASSGKRRISRWNRMLMRVNMKIARFKRYKEEEKIPAKKSKRRGWDTAGLEKYATLLKECIKKGPKRKTA